MNRINIHDEEITLKSVCCTCLSVERKLTQLCRLDNGVNDLFFIFSYKSETYETMFFKDVTQLFICWECTALLKRLRTFREQAWVAQKQLSDIVDGKVSNSSKIKCLSKLTHTFNTIYNVEIVINEPIDNFIDCGHHVEDTNTENGVDDVSLSELKDEGYNYECEPIKDTHPNKDAMLSTIIETETLRCSNKSNFTAIQMTEEEMLESIELRKLNKSYVNSLLKCESCVEGFKGSSKIRKHNLEFHKQKPKHIQCDICKVYVITKLLLEHRNEHYFKYKCDLCTEMCYSKSDVLHHLKIEHSVVVSDTGLSTKIKIGLERDVRKTSHSIVSMDPRPHAYLCTECNKYFDTKSKRYKHVQKYHREGFKCSTCGKKFPFKNALARHEQIHSSALPREQCPTCGKMIRKDHVRKHAQIHTERKSFSCVKCDKRFISRESYEHHLKYTKNHARVGQNIFKYQCSICKKFYRSPGELRDHVNYQHMGKTRHKCPVCDKALATRRCITRHVRRAHHGVKENTLDKICQTCGKVFRDSKCFREHELIHTGERPLSCDICGRSFRQSSSLYMHKRRVHKIAPIQKIVKHSEETGDIDDKMINSGINGKKVYL